MIEKNNGFIEHLPSLVGRRAARPASDALHLSRGIPGDIFRTVSDFCAALILLVVASPVILLAALFIKITSRGPAFYTQTRMGRKGRAYTIYKLRTMKHNCESVSGPCWSIAGDDRVTAVGRLLRKTHLDEFPQLWNVVRGEMSLVGPRPERPEFMPQLASAIPLYRARLMVHPGVTGLAQVQLPPDTDLPSVRLKLAYDLYYVAHRSLGLDLRIIAATTLKMLGLPYAMISRVLFLPRGEVVENQYRAFVDEHRTEPIVRRRNHTDSDDMIDLEMAPCG